MWKIVVFLGLKVCVVRGREQKNTVIKNCKIGVYASILCELNTADVNFIPEPEI